MTLAAANYTWYMARAGGILAFVLLTASVVVGLLLSGRARLRSWPRFALEDVHRFGTANAPRKAKASAGFSVSANG